MRIWNPMCGRKNTLYHELHDTEVAVLGMIRQGMTRTNIQQAIRDLCKDGTIDAAKEKSLLELVQSLSGGLLDTDKVSFSANAQFIAKASQNAATHMTAAEALTSLKQREENSANCGTRHLLHTVVMMTWERNLPHSILRYSN